ncbi:MAG: type II secretion system F family protein [Gammaproteobacteria bacterium]|nr:type II secretion system F family protein [Gammaproteobacteria bacterium]NNF59874.1 type II secretion system F family protein [Gammaproteobacteria bacterium]NNM21485.1 type II secretion system F family protein [Gammaproteobacteria bacterium]
MDYLLAILKTTIQDTDVVRIVFVLLVAAAVFGIGISVSMLAASATSPLRRRLNVGQSPAPASAANKLAKTIEPVSGFLLPTKEKELNAVRANLVHAGYRTQNAVSVFYALKALLALSLPFIVLLLAPFFPQLQTSVIIFITMSAAAAGVAGPNIYLRRQVRRRQRALRHGFPDALDLLVVCVEAGLGLSAAVQRVAAEICVSHPELGEDLLLVTCETRAGVDSVTALKNLAARTGLEDIRGLVTLLAQSMRFGTSIADTLRVYSEEFRDKRMQAAEEQAAKLGTKLIFPLVTCLFPAFFVVTIGPAILKVLAAVGRI